MSITETIRAVAGYAHQDADFSTGEICESIANERRRRIIDVLRREHALTVRELAEHVASVECGKPVEQLRGNEYKRVYVAILQTHAGRLEELGIIELVDGDSGTVHQGPNFEDAVRTLDAVREITGGDL